MIVDIFADLGIFNNAGRLAQPLSNRGASLGARGKTMLELKPIVHAILTQYPLPQDGIHGIAHWARVLETGVRLSK